jgi:hypothetical protein
VPEAPDRLLDVEGLVEGDVHPHAGGHAERLRHRRLDRVHLLHRVGPGLLVRAQGHGALAVHPDDGLLGLPGVLDAPHIAHPDGRAVDPPDDDALHGLHHGELVVGEHVVVDGPELRVARRHEEVRLVDGPGHLGGRDPFGIEEVTVQVDGDLADPAAVHVGRGHAGKALELGLHRVGGQVAELLLVEPAPGERDEAHGDVGEVELEDEGGCTPACRAFMSCRTRCTALVRPASRSAPQLNVTSTAEKPWRERDSTWRTLVTVDTAFSMG